MSDKKPTRGRPENPALQEQQKKRLLDAAETLLQTATYRSITIRQIAELADMKSAMISYYFGGKEGLFVALVNRLAEKKLQDISQIKNAENPLKALIHKLLQTMQENQHFARLLFDEAVTQQSTLGKHIVEQLPSRMAELLPNLIIAEQQAGNIRNDLCPKWAAFSLVSLLALPVIGAPIRRMAWGISDEDIANDAWAEHIYTLFLQGVMAR